MTGAAVLFLVRYRRGVTIEALTRWTTGDRGDVARSLHMLITDGQIRQSGRYFYASGPGWSGDIDTDGIEL